MKVKAHSDELCSPCAAAADNCILAEIGIYLIFWTATFCRCWMQKTQPAWMSLKNYKIRFRLTLLVLWKNSSWKLLLVRLDSSAPDISGWKSFCRSEWKKLFFYRRAVWPDCTIFIVLDVKFYHKSSPNIWILSEHFLKRVTFKVKTAVAIFWQVLEKIGLLFILTSGHTAGKT